MHSRDVSPYNHFQKEGLTGSDRRGLNGLGMDPNSNNEGEQRVRKRQKRSLLTSRSITKRMTGRWILGRNWVSQRMSLCILIGILLMLLGYYMFKHKDSVPYYFFAPQEN